MAILRYPEGLDGSQSDYIKFKFFQYEPALKGGAQSTNVAYNASISGLTAKGDEITITMPNDISSNFTGDWGSFNMTGLGRTVVGSVAGSIDATKDPKKLTNISSLLGGFQSAFSATAGGAVEDGLRAIANGLNNVQGLGGNFSASTLLGLTGTVIVNPNTELLYGGTQLRKHGYRFKMIAQSDTEAQKILDIAKAFKVSAAPKGDDQKFLNLTNRNFIGIPDVCKVSFHLAGSSNEHPHLPKYKLSAITGVSVDYITEGQYMTFSDGKPIGINLNVELTELKLVFSNEIEGGSVA